MIRSRATKGSSTSAGGAVLLEVRGGRRAVDGRLTCDPDGDASDSDESLVLKDGLEGPRLDRLGAGEYGLEEGKED